MAHMAHLSETKEVDVEQDIVNVNNDHYYMYHLNRRDKAETSLMYSDISDTIQRDIDAEVQLDAVRADKCFDLLWNKYYVSVDRSTFTDPIELQVPEHENVIMERSVATKLSGLCESMLDETKTLPLYDMSFQVLMYIVLFMLIETTSKHSIVDEYFPCIATKHFKRLVGGVTYMDSALSKYIDRLRWHKLLSCSTFISQLYLSAASRPKNSLTSLEIVSLLDYDGYEFDV